MGLAIAGVTTLLAVLFLDRGRAGGLAAAILIVMYLLNVIAQLSPDMRGLANLSAFHYFDLKSLIDTGAYPVDGLAHLRGRRDHRLGARAARLPATRPGRLTTLGPKP